jgi:signal transduction histidine kinase
VWLCRVTRFLGHAEQRTVPSGAAQVADAAIAAAAMIAAVVAVLMQARGPAGAIVVFPTPGGQVIRYSQGQVPQLSLGVLLGTALTTVPLAFRRIYPITAFCVILGAVIATSGHTTSITFASAIFAAYSAAAYSRFRQLALLSVLAGAVVVTAAYPDTTPPVPERFTALLILLPTVSVGAAIRTWRGRASESAERLRRAQAEHEEQTRRAVEVERARIASEMHDVVTHNVSVMVVQAGAARRVLDSSPGDAREALLAVEASGRTAMTELRHLLGLLAPSVAAESGDAEPGPHGAADPGGTARGAGLDGAGDAALAPQPGVARIPALLARVRAAGMPAELSVAAPAGMSAAAPAGMSAAAPAGMPGGSPPDLPPGIDVAAYRVVQEGLTNVMKHAEQARTAVRLEYRARDLLITVSDDGPAPDSAPEPGSVSGGRGLIGLRERIAVYGGELDAGPRPGGGWRLTARIPLEPPPAPPQFQAEPGPAPPQFQAASW